MLRPVSTLRISENSMKELIKHGYCFLEDILKNPESRKFLTEKELNIFNIVPKAVESINLLIKEPKKEKILISCEDFNHILDGGFECGTITELCGGPGSGKSQICFQASVAAQLDKKYGGLNGKVVYIDTRNGFSALRLLVNECQQRWVRLREKFSKEKRMQEECERTGNRRFKLTPWPFYEELKFLEPFIKRRNVYHKPRNLDSKILKNSINQKVNSTVFNTQSFTQIKPIPAATIATQPVGFNPSNLSFVQVPKTVMVQLVGSNQNHNSNSIITDPLSPETPLPNNVEVIYQNEESCSESGSSASVKTDNSTKNTKKHKRKSDDYAENAVTSLSLVIERFLDTYKKEETDDEIFGRLVACELAKKDEPEKSRLKKLIMQNIWSDDLES